MEFTVKNLNKSINDVTRTIGYMPAYFSAYGRSPEGRQNGEVSIVRQLGRNNYPRFHLYITQNDRDFIFKLHLDQKKPSYKGSHAHSGEYDGQLIKGETQRIKNLLVGN